MSQDLISPEVRGALYDYFAHLPGATEQIRKFANAAGLSQSKTVSEKIPSDVWGANTEWTGA